MAVHALLVACAGCAAASAPLTLFAQIDALVGDAPCSLDDACRSVAIGALACGGPESYRAWSIERTDAATLFTLAARQREERLREITRTGELSTCTVVADPGAFCQRLPAATSGRCRLRPSGAPAGNSALR